MKSQVLKSNISVASPIKSLAIRVELLFIRFINLVLINLLYTCYLIALEFSSYSVSLQTYPNLNV